LLSNTTIVLNFCGTLSGCILKALGDHCCNVYQACTVSPFVVVPGVDLDHFTVNDLGYQAMDVGYEAMGVGYKAMSAGYKAVVVGYEAMDVGYK